MWAQDVNLSVFQILWINADEEVFAEVILSSD